MMERAIGAIEVDVVLLLDYDDDNDGGDHDLTAIMLTSKLPHGRNLCWEKS